MSKNQPKMHMMDTRERKRSMKVGGEEKEHGNDGLPVGSEFGYR